jgi:hypothetical protein
MGVEGNWLKSNNMGILFESLDFLYVPAPDIDAAIGYYTGVLGSKLLGKFMHLGCGRHAYKF